MNRRGILQVTAGVLLKGVLAGVGAFGALGPGAALASDVRRLALVNTHTGDAFNDVYWRAGAYVPDALRAIDQVMRDHRSGETHAIDPNLLDQLNDLAALVDASAPYQIISGYRSPQSNAVLQAQSHGVATRSLHMDGRAIDVRVGGVDLPRLRDAAIAMRRGGVGYYESSDFIHLDTGRVRRW